MESTLSERYVAATINSLGTGTGTVEDVRAELEALIADAAEARTEQGETPENAEHAVLTELGDPAILAAGYADRALHLIGPRYYLLWKRLLKLLLIIVPTTAVAGVTLAQILAGSSVGATVGQAFVVGITTIVHVAFWLTVVFVSLERSGADIVPKWDVGQLAGPKDDHLGQGSLIVTLIFYAVAAAVLLWDHLIGLVRLSGEPLPILNPGLWPWAILAAVLLIAAEGLVAFLVYRARRWTTALAIANTALAVIFMGLALTLLGRGLLFNPEFIAQALSANDVNDDSIRTLGILTGFMIAGIAAWDIADGWLRSARSARLKR